jgi:DNA-binding XRE family transcriptional regulator
MSGPRPVTETHDTVTLNRADYEALLDELEDARDLAIMRESEARVAAGEEEFLPVGMVERLLAGEHPVRVWRRHRGLTGQALAATAGLAPSYLCEIETGKKPGSFDAMARIAKALGVAMEDLRVEAPPRDQSADG